MWVGLFTLGLLIENSLFEIVLALMILEIGVYSLLYLVKWYHLIILLIILELFILKTYFICVGGLNLGLRRYFSYIFITLRVSEARVGLSLLTIMVRLNGDDSVTLGNI